MTRVSKLIFLPSLLRQMALFFILLLALTANSAHAETVLKNVEFFPQAGGGVKIDLDFSEAVTMPKSFTTDQPARIAFDFPGVKNAVANKQREIKVGLTENLSIAEAGDRTRVIIGLTKLAAFSVDVKGKQVMIPDFQPKMLRMLWIQNKLKKQICCLMLILRLRLHLVLNKYKVLIFVVRRKVRGVFS